MHGFIDGETGDVYQTLPWNHRGWHCSSGVNGSANNTHIGVEMCEPAVELFAFLCGEYGLEPLADGVVISHSEGHTRGVASNHGDPVHLWNQLGLDYTMDGFRQDVKKAMGTGSGTSDADAGSDTSQMYRVRKIWADARLQIGAFRA